ncbi:hypothetical protein GCM10011375_37810 [Hymenobacter qilianensis]|nr:sigma-70 family RNA polymerase sigma factor [Hymenobacter qilianensis]GGF79230.1 hypothetical protein GCM10011375_37810 [Hymenobacter qilianensis]
MLPSSESALLERLYARDPSAMVDFYDRYGAAMYGLLRRLLRDDALAEDLLQEALVKIWQQFPTYQAAKGSLFTWALTLCRNLALDQLRSRRAHQARQTQSLEGSPALAHASAGFQPEHVGVRELVAQLPPAQRQLLELLYVEGYTVREAAQELELPLGTVRTRTRAALRSLRHAAGQGG